MPSSTKPTYVARTPGLKCQRCGKDISYRTAATKYCTECSKAMNLENGVARRALFAKLLKRDTPLPPYHTTDFIYYCHACGTANDNPGNFCYHCGQRFKEGDFSGKH